MASNTVLSRQERFEQEDPKSPGISLPSLRGSATGMHVIPHEFAGERPIFSTWLGAEELPKKSPQRQGISDVEISGVRPLFDHAVAGLKQEISGLKQEIADLKKSYLFRDRGIDSFLESHRALVSVLQQAVTPLKEAFGDDAVFRLELETEEEGSRMIYATALCSGSVQEAAKALDQFADRWWLDHMTNQTGELAFIYRIWR